MRLRIAEGQDIGRTLALGPDGLRIGRGQDNDLPLPEEGVSRRHCEIRFADGSWWIEDLNSTNGVLVNGQRIRGSRSLAPGDRIGIGKHLLLVEDEASSLPAPPPLVEPPPPEAPPSLPRSTVTPDPRTTAASRPEPLWDDGDLPVRRRLPWVRLVLLVLLVGVIAALAFVVFRGSSPPPTDNEGSGALTASAGVTPAPREVSDAELASLIAAEEQSGPRIGTPTPTAGSATTAIRVPPTVAGGSPAEAIAPVAETGRAVVSDLVFVASDPPGALVLVDGAERGVTPLLVRDLAKGRHRIVLRFDGYEDFERQIHVPDLLPARPYALRARPGTLYVASASPGTAIWRGPQLLGVAPVLLQGLSPGPHDLVFVAPGCEPLRQTVTVSEVSSERVEVVPKPLLGALELAIQPAGCTVSIEGTVAAVSQPADPTGLAAVPLRLDGLRAGTHTVAVEHPIGIGRSGKLTIRAGETASQAIRLWLPDSRVDLNDGTAKTGMIVERNGQGDLVLAENPRQLERYLKPQVAQITPLTREETTELLRKQGLLPAAGAAPASRAETRTDGRPAAKEKTREGADRDGAKAKGPDDAKDPWGDAPAADATAAREDASIADQYTVGKLLELIRETPGIEVVRRLKDRRITLRGLPTSIGKDGPDPYLAFDRRIRCYLDRGHYEAAKDTLRAAVEAKTELLVTGGQAGLRGDLLVLKDCEAKPLPKDGEK
jgi:hypothetical protein